MEDIFDVYSQKRAVQYLREKCYLSPEASLYLMQLTRKNPVSLFSLEPRSWRFFFNFKKFLLTKKFLYYNFFP